MWKSPLKLTVQHLSIFERAVYKPNTWILSLHGSRVPEPGSVHGPRDAIALPHLGFLSKSLSCGTFESGLMVTPLIDAQVVVF